MLVALCALAVGLIVTTAAGAVKRGPTPVPVRVRRARRIVRR